MQTVSVVKSLEEKEVLVGSVTMVPIIAQTAGKESIQKDVQERNAQKSSTGGRMKISSKILKGYCAELAGRQSTMNIAQIPAARRYYQEKKMLDGSGTTEISFVPNALPSNEAPAVLVSLPFAGRRCAGRC